MDPHSLTWVDSVILGIVQGLTEFLPVSSDGHLVLARHLLNYQKEILVFDVLLHMGTLGSLFFIFYKDTLNLISDFRIFVKDFFKSPMKAFQNPQHKYLLFVVITTFVTGIVGLVFEKGITELFTSMGAAAFGFACTSAFLFWAAFHSSGKKKVTEMKWSFPIWIGLAQALALLPGASRSGSTIVLALGLSVHRKEAGRYSFVVAIPIIALASIYQMRHLLTGDHEAMSTMMLGVVTAFVVGVFAIRLLLWMLEKQKLLPFAIYTGLLAVFCLVYASIY